MIFASPLWLIGFVPWALLALWLFFHRRETTAVPFLPLWVNYSRRPLIRRQLGVPPLSLWLLLLAIALSLFGAAGPQAKTRARSSASISVPQAAIIVLSASDVPHSQVMVQVTTAHFDRQAIELRVASGVEHVNQTIAVPANGSRNVFVDLRSLSETVTASLANATSILIERKGRPIDIAVDARVPATLRRLIDLTQNKHKPPRKNALTLAVDSSLAPALNLDRPGIILAPPTDSTPTNWTVMDDPLTRDVDWSELVGGCRVDPSWNPLIFSGDRVLVARRKQPPLQILTSVATIDWPSRPSFVVFWSNAIDWLAGGDGDFDRYQSRLVETTPTAAIVTPRDLSPGLFLSALGMLAAAGLFVPRQAIPYTSGHVEFNARTSGE